MARTQKDTVEYFPHDADASAGDTLTVLEGQFGNDGYAFWFKLLERLASSEGHFIDCSNSNKWQLLLARARVNQLQGVEMLKLLVEMGAIDKQLWEQDKIIWCQHLVDNVAEVYRNRRRDIPLKPHSTPLKLLTTPQNLLTTPDNTQSKVKESKQKETKEESSSLSKEDVIEVYKKEIAGLYEEESLSEIIEKDIEATINIFSAAWVIDAIHEAVSRKNRTWRYVTGILKNWKRFGKNYVQGKSDPDKYIKGKYGHMVRR